MARKKESRFAQFAFGQWRKTLNLEVLSWWMILGGIHRLRIAIMPSIGMNIEERDIVVPASQVLAFSIIKK